MFREERIWLTHKWRMKKKEPPPPNKTERLHVMKMIFSFLLFFVIYYATTSTHAKTRNSTERHDKEKAKSTYLTARLFLCLLFYEMTQHHCWLYTLWDHLTCSYFLFLLLFSSILFTPKIYEKWHDR